jgi:Fe-S-cluster containining protein
MMGDDMAFRYPKGVRFECTRCALCCGDTEERVRHILLLESEAETISKIVSKPVEEFARKVAGQGPYACEMKKTRVERACVFLVGRTCTVYAVRPLLCRFYPFQLQQAGDGKGVFSYTEECPAIGKGERLKRGYFRDLFEEARVRVEADGSKRV